MLAADGAFVSFADALRAPSPTDAPAVAEPVAAQPLPMVQRVGDGELLALKRDVRALHVRLAETEALLAAARTPAPLVVPLPEERVPLTTPFWTGIRALDGPLCFGRGARVGIFGAAGAGKSTLLEALVDGSSADATVVALIGERGREAERWLGRAGPRTNLVCATADRPAAERLAAAEAAFVQADALRARGLHVLLVLDSLARVAAAARDVAIAAGEPLGRGGFPPSVVARQARLLECAGATAQGSITLVATVLSEGPLEHDPVAEAARAALDGHLVLSARLAAAGWFPALDLPASASRTLADVATPAHRAAAGKLRGAVAALDAAREARALGLDPSAGDRTLARTIAAEGRIARFLRGAEGPSDPAETLKLMSEIADSLDDG